ncbi:hypothetical protein [Thiomicrorhabdus sp. 6S3-12]|uniref:hypothetical protein n=1 Tax=Thiomicrorhabdus sp. 6S3-12 TaxID=2819681 RepID=UPI001AAD7BB8|nr:hypothetical protein [Thiomicrorhabdus sp. 6S3-12]MBO1924650.1 hypothetical protein [Thiomicrorhabdus sp. 6S3-12]
MSVFLRFMQITVVYFSVFSGFCYAQEAVEVPGRDVITGYVLTSSEKEVSKQLKKVFNVTMQVRVETVLKTSNRVQANQIIDVVYTEQYPDKQVGKPFLKRKIKAGDQYRFYLQKRSESHYFICNKMETIAD